jgi:hypothetical protein
MIEGYKMHRFDPSVSLGSKRSSMGGGPTSPSPLDFPSVVTIFSAPNYCGTYDNKGAYFILDRGAV